MTIPKEIIYQKIEKIIEEIDFRNSAFLLEERESIEMFGGRIEDTRFSLYEAIYNNLGEPEKELCICFHSKLNALFDFLNYKSKMNRHYNAESSRDLIGIIEKINLVRLLLTKIGKELVIEDYYKNQIDYVRTFLVESGGSAIPENFEKINITDVEPILFVRDANLTVKIHNQDKITREFAKDQLNKCKKKINEGDYSGAITNARSLVEDVVCKEIYKQITGEILESKGDLVSDWKELSKKLNLDVEKIPDDFLKQILRGLSSIVQGLASLRNKMSDGHSQNYKSEKHHAILAVNSALTLVEFLFDTLEFQNLYKNKAQLPKT